VGRRDRRHVRPAHGDPRRRALRARCHAPFAVAGYIAAAYWFTSSTSFANPAVTIGRTLSDTFAGIRWTSAPAFIAAQLAGGVAAIALARYLFPDLPAVDMVVPHDRAEAA
jgi:arsenate reductase